MSHPTCSSCTHWRPEQSWEVPPGWGYCYADRTKFDVHSGGLGADLVTAPDFYCAQHPGAGKPT